MAGMLYLILTTQRTVNKLWNPYDILGISESYTEKEIKSHYKKLGRKFHPDKIRPDPAKNETIESLNDAWVELTKAYQALTDEEIRNNYIQYGHPDGKQGFSIGIALPKFIVLWLVEGLTSGTESTENLYRSIPSGRVFSWNTYGNTPARTRQSRHRGAPSPGLGSLQASEHDTCPSLPWWCSARSRNALPSPRLPGELA